MHHILEFCTSCWYYVAKWLWKKAHIGWRKRCQFRFSRFCSQFSWQYHRSRHKRVSSFFHDIIYFSTTFFSNIFQNPQIRLRKTKIKHLKKSHFLPTFAHDVFVASPKQEFSKQFEILFFLCIFKNFKVAWTQIFEKYVCQRCN